MGLNLGVMSAAVVLDDSDYRRKLSGLEGASENTFKRIAKLAAGYLSTRALFGFVQGAMAEFSKLEEGNNKLIHSYKELGNEAIRVAEGIAKEYGLANQTASNAIADIGDMLTGLGFESRDALNFAKKITLRGIDIASFKGLDQSETIRRMTVALTGETESLKSMGIVVRQGSEEFQEHVKSIMDATGATETMAKAQVILKEIMEQSKNAAGDYKNPGRTYAQELSDLKEAVKQFKAEIGNQIQPITQETVVKARELLQWYNKLTPSTKSLLNVTTALASALLILNKTSFGKSIMNAKGASDAEVQAQQAKAREEVIRAENQMTTAQMEKNLAEQNLALAKNATSAAENAEEHARAALTRAQASGDTAAIASAQQALVQATKATTEAKLNEAKASQALREKNVALTTATERFSTLSAALPGLLTSISASASLAGKMSIFMSGGFRAAATAVKTFLTSIGPVGWAIIAAAVSFEAVSLAVSLYNGKLEENARLAKEAADAAANASSKNAEETRSKVSAMERLKELQKYEKLNNAEKEEAKELLKNLGIAYDENAASIDAMISKQGAEKKSLAEIIAMRKEELKQQRIAALQKQIQANQAAVEKNGESYKYYEENMKLRQEIYRLQNDEQKLGETEEERSRNNSESARKLRDELKSISEKEWKIKFDSASAYDQVDMLTAKMDEAFSELKRKGKFTSIEQFKTSDRTKMNSEELEALKKIIDLEQQRANINKRITDERKQAAEALRSAQENRAYQNADEAGKIASLDKRIAEKQAELKNKRVRVDAEASPEKISELEQKIAELKDRRVKVDAEANPEQIAALEKQLAELKDKRIKVDADASPEKIEALEKQLTELKNNRARIDAEANPERISELEKKIADLKDKRVQIDAEASPEHIAELEKKLSEIKDKRVRVDTEASPEKISALEEKLSKLKDKRVQVDAEADPEQIEELETRLKELKDRRVKVDSEANPERIIELEKKISELKNKRVKVDAEASPEQILELEKRIKDLKDKRVEVDAEASTDKISELEKKISALKDKRVQVDTEANPKQIAELEKKLSELKNKAAYTKEELELQQKIVRLEQQRDEIRKRSANAFMSEREAYAKMDADLRKREYDQTVQREIEAAKQKGDTSGVTEIMKRELDRAKQAADLMRSQYEQALKSAEADSIMTEEEKKRLQELRSKLQDALSDQNSWQSKVADQEKKDKSMKKEAVAWSSEVLNAQLGGILKPQEDMAKNTKRIANIALSIERKMNKKQGEVLS